MYRFGELIHSSQFKYSLSTVGAADSIDAAPMSKSKRYHAIYAALVQMAFILYWYYEAILGQVTSIEFFFIVGVNSFLVLKNVCEWYFIHPFYRGRIISLMNYPLE
jgi:hypothetical protein